MHVIASQGIAAVCGRAGQRIAVCGSVDVSAPALRTAASVAPGATSMRTVGRASTGQARS